MRLAAIGFCLVVASAFAVMAAMVLLSYDGYDTTFGGHAVVALMWIMPGLLFGFFAWALWPSKRRR